MNDLLKVLDMSSEEEQFKWLCDKGITDGSLAISQVTNKVVTHWIRIEFADLAFRLRDEMKGSEGHEAWSLGQRIVYDYCFNLPENRPSLKYPRKQAKYYDDQKQFFADNAKPIHWIIAALKAKERQVKGEL